MKWRWALCLTALVLQCTSPAAAVERVMVSASASLKDAFLDLARAYEREHSGVKIKINFAGAAQLASQIEQSAPVDLFASADLTQIRRLVDRKLAADWTVFARNRLVVIVSRQPSVPIASIGELGRMGVRLITAARQVPIREYTEQCLKSLDDSRLYGADFRRRVLANVISEELDVRMAAVKVGLGEGDAAFVYATDVTSDIKGKVDVLEVPDALNVMAEYGLALTSADRDASLGLYQHVLGSEAQRRLAAFGFIPRLQE
jgi:molybdate transport system substrate-binding protein